MSHQMISCPGCKSKIRFNEKSGRSEIKCPRCRRVIGVSRTGSVKVQETQSMPVRRGDKPEDAGSDSQAEMRRQRQATPAEDQDEVVAESSGRPRSARRKRGGTDPKVEPPRAASASGSGILARTELQMFLLGLVSALVVGFSGLTLFVALRPDSSGVGQSESPEPAPESQSGLNSGERITESSVTVFVRLIPTARLSAGV